MRIGETPKCCAVGSRARSSCLPRRSRNCRIPAAGARSSAAKARATCPSSLCAADNRNDPCPGRASVCPSAVACANGVDLGLGARAPPLPRPARSTRPPLPNGPASDRAIPATRPPRAGREQRAVATWVRFRQSRDQAYRAASQGCSGSPRRGGGLRWSSGPEDVEVDREVVVHHAVPHRRDPTCRRHVPPVGLPQLPGAGTVLCASISAHQRYVRAGSGQRTQAA